MASITERLRAPLKGLSAEFNRKPDQMRRQLIKTVALIALSEVLRPIPTEARAQSLVEPEGTTEQANTTVEKEPRAKVSSRLGMHLHPDVDPETDSIWKSDVEKIKPTLVVVLIPGDREIPQAKLDQITWLVDEGITPVVRFHTQDNRYSQIYGKHIQVTAQKIQEATNKKDIAFQMFNEVNLKHEETGNTYISPEEHIRNHFRPAADIITQRGGIVAFTPPAPRGECKDEHGHLITAQAYLERMLLEAKKQWGLEWILEKAIVAIHPYVFEENGLLVEEIKSYYQAAKRALGIDPRIIVTETNAILTSVPNATEETRIRVLRNMLSEELPGELDNIEGICLFPWTNGLSRGNYTPPDDHARLMEAMAIRKSADDVDSNNGMLRAVLEATAISSYTWVLLLINKFNFVSTSLLNRYITDVFTNYLFFNIGIGK